MKKRRDIGDILRNGGDFKLRPLSDMTEKEAREMKARGEKSKAQCRARKNPNWIELRKFMVPWEHGNYERARSTRKWFSSLAEGAKKILGFIWFTFEFICRWIFGTPIWILFK